MAVPTQLSDLSATAVSNSPAGGDTIGTTADDYLRAIQSIIARIAAGTDKIAPAGVTGTAAILGANTFTGLQTLQAGSVVTGAVVSGYGTGAGGTVTQLTSKSTGVTLNKPCGIINTHNENIVAGTGPKVFQVTNSLVADTDNVLLTLQDGNGFKYNAWAYSVTAGSFYVALRNIYSTDLAEAIPINFAVIKSVTS